MYKYKFVNKFTLILSLFIMLILTTGISTKKDDFSGKIYKNIYIEELNIGKMKINEAKDVVNEKYLLKPIYIKYEDKIWCINPEDIELSYNINEAIKNAYLYTRNDNKLENIKRKCSLELNKEYNIKLNVTYNESKLSEQLSYIQRDINKQVKQATIEISDNGQMIATKSKEGLEVDIISLKEQIYDMIKNKDIKNINLPVKIIKPTITTKQVKSINTILGQFSTSFNEYSSR